MGLHAALFVLPGEKIPRQVGLHAELVVPPGEKDSPTGGAACRALCTSKVDASTETHIHRLYDRTGRKKNIAAKSHREPPVFARKGQNGVAQAQTPGAEARISRLEPAPAVR